MHIKFKHEHPPPQKKNHNNQHFKNFTMFSSFSFFYNKIAHQNNYMQKQIDRKSGKIVRIMLFGCKIHVKDFGLLVVTKNRLTFKT